MRVRCVKAYKDLQLKRLVKAGEELEVADARATVLCGANVAEALTTPEVVTKPAPKSRKKKSER